MEARRGGSERSNPPHYLAAEGPERGRIVDELRRLDADRGEPAFELIRDRPEGLPEIGDGVGIAEPTARPPDHLELGRVAPGLAHRGTQDGQVILARPAEWVPPAAVLDEPSEQVRVQGLAPEPQRRPLGPVWLRLERDLREPVMPTLERRGRVAPHRSPGRQVLVQQLAPLLERHPK